MKTTNEQRELHRRALEHAVKDISPKALYTTSLLILDDFDFLRAQLERAIEVLNKYSALETAYRKPEGWNSAKMGGPPNSLDDLDQVELSDIATEALADIERIGHGEGGKENGDGK